MGDRHADVARRHIADVGGREAQFNQELGALVRARRRSLEMTQEQLADAVGVARGSIANLERGAQAPTAFRMARLAAALRCTPTDLMPEPNASVSLGRVELSDSQRTAVENVRLALASQPSSRSKS